MKKSWLIRISLFVVVQFVFILIDGTAFVPLLNDMGQRMTEIVGPSLEWITLYESIYLKIITVIFVVYLIISAVEDMRVFSKKKRAKSK